MRDALLHGRLALAAPLIAIVASWVFPGCNQKWDTSARPIQDEVLESEFFSGLDSDVVPDIPEPSSLRPCCVFGSDVGVQLGRVPLPGYELQNVLDVAGLGSHQYNKGTAALEPKGSGSERILSDEASGMLYTCRGGFIDVAHVRDNADRTLFLVSRLAGLASSGGTIALSDEGGARRIVVRPIDPALVRTNGLREVLTSLGEWLAWQLSIWHEIATWYGWSATPFSERPSAFSPEDLYSNALGVKIAATAIRRHAAATEIDYNRNVTSLLHDALGKLGPLPQDASRRAFDYVDGIWWDSTRRVPESQLVRHRNFELGPKLSPWKLIDAQPSEILRANAKEFDDACGGDWSPLVLTMRGDMAGKPFDDFATIEIRPDPVVREHGFAAAAPNAELVTQRDFPSIVSAIERAADAELGPGAGRPAARSGETSRYRR